MWSNFLQRFSRFRYKGILHVLAVILLSCSMSWEQSVDIRVFRSMKPAERIRVIQDLPLWKTDSANTSLILSQLFPVVEEEKDHRALFALKFQQFLYRTKLKLAPSEILQLLSEMENMAGAKGWEVEYVVARHYHVFEQYDLRYISTERMYAEVIKTFDQMQELGFDRFQDYQAEGILFELGHFMYDLEDLEKMYGYLSVAERFIRFDEKGLYHACLILNHLETYFHLKKDYSKAVEYAQKILHCCRSMNTALPENEWRREFWEGFASLEIAELLAEQGKLEESEYFADLGYKKSKVTYTGVPYAAMRGEYDATQVLLAIKLKLRKLDEAATLIRRSETLRQQLESDPKADVHYFESLKYFKNCARYYELRGDDEAAMRYMRLTQTLQDSFTRRNDAHKYEQIKRRIEAEKYIRQLELIESEKQFQKWLLYAALIILTLVLVLAYGWFHRFQYIKRQKEKELEAAKHELANLSQNFREKADLAENLRHEMDKLASQDLRSEYLERLTHSVILTDDDWTRFRELFEKVYPGFIGRQKTLYPELTRAELRLLALEKLDLQAREIANILGISTNTVYQTRLRMRKKDGNRIS